MYLGAKAVTVGISRGEGVGWKIYCSYSRGRGDCVRGSVLCGNVPRTYYRENIELWILMNINLLRIDAKNLPFCKYLILSITSKIIA